MERKEDLAMVFGYEYNGRFITIKSVDDKLGTLTVSYIDDRIFRVYDGYGDKISGYAEMEAKQKIDQMNEAASAEFGR